MNPHIENSLKEWLVAEGFTNQIVCGFDAATISATETCIVCAVDDSEHVVGPLEKAICHFVVQTPAHGGTVAAHKATCKTIWDLLQDADLSSLSSQITEHGGGKTFGGLAPLAQSSSIENGRWITDLSFIMGLK